MLINLRNALMTGKRLPYDAELEYLESTGTQWIDTGVVPSVGCSMEIDAAFTNNPVESYLGGVHWDNNRGFAVGIVKNLNSSKFTALAGHSSVSAGSIDTQRHKFSLIINTSRSATFSVDDSSATDGSITFLASDLKIPLLARRRSSSTLDYYASSFLYACKIRVGGLLVRDFIPVRKGTVGYLYDRVSGKLFGNAGTGDFVLGPDVVPVEYIESHGTEWIDTGVIPSSGIVFAVEMSTPTTTASRLNGSFTNTGPRRFMVGVSQSNKIQFGCDALYTTTIDNDGLRHRLEVDTVDLVYRIDSSSVMSISSSPVFPDLSIYLFARHRDGTAVIDGYLSGRIYRSQIAINGTPVRSFRPVRVGTDATSWEGAMMDVLTRRIYRNAGTGAFTYGNDLRYPIPSE